MLTLASGPIHAVIDPAIGARLLSLKIDGTELIPDHDQRDPDFLRGSFPLAPWCGLLPESDHPDLAGTMHGLVHSSPWTVTQTCPTRVTLETWIGSGTPRPWLGRGRLQLDYELDAQSLTMRLSVTAVEGDWPAALGFHPWFRRRLDGHSGAARYTYSPQARLVLVDQRWPREPTEDLGPYPHDDLFIALASPPEIHWPTGMGLRLEADADVWVIYERDAHGFCIEPWTDVDGPLHGHRRPPLKQGETRELTLKLNVLRPTDEPEEDHHD